MKYGKATETLTAKTEYGAEVEYRLIESEGRYGNTDYTLMVSENNEISYLERVCASRDEAVFILKKLYKNRVSPVVLYDVLEEML